MIIAESLKNKVIITIEDSNSNTYRIQRMKKGGEWEDYFNGEFYTPDYIEENFRNEENTDLELISFVFSGSIIDTKIEDGLYTYRYCSSEIEAPESKDFQYSNWVKCGNTGPIGYTFNNYCHAEGSWGSVITPDDIRYTYLWGTDFKAANGASMDDSQIQFFIDSAVADIERLLNITIKKKRIVCEAKSKGLEKNKDYDIEESLYEFSYRKISQMGKIRTRQRPILEVKKLDLVTRLTQTFSLMDSIVVDNQKGIINFLKRPIKPTDTYNGINTAIGMYGNNTYSAHLFYDIEYVAGFENADDIDMDLREVIAKKAAISMLNIVGDGLMSGFSSSSLSMDGISESFSSTQSATSAYFGARIKVYEDNIKDFIKQNKLKYTNLPMGCL